MLQRPRVAVVHDSRSPAGDVPALKAFGRGCEVAHVDLAESDRLPASDHCVITCAHARPEIYAIADEACRHGAQLTFLARHVDAGLARYARMRHANLLPTSGYADQISPATLHAALRRVVAGREVVAEGFVANSIGRYVGSRHTVIRALTEASGLANASHRVVAAVLSQHRTGSNFLRDLIGLTVSGTVDVFHEHAVPDPSSGEPGSVHRQRRATRHDQIMRAARRFIFVCERNPTERLISYFIERHMALLAADFHPVAGLRHSADVQRTFDQWVSCRARAQRDWYTRRLSRTFGIGVLDCTRTADGVFIGERGENTLIIVPTSSLSALRDTLAASFGGDAYGVVATNSVTRRSTGVDAAFRRQIRVDPGVEEMLWSIPEVEHVLGRAPVPLALASSQ